MNYVTELISSSAIYNSCGYLCDSVDLGSGKVKATNTVICDVRRINWHPSLFVEFNSFHI